jgi:hypothetical protein
VQDDVSENPNLEGEEEEEVAAGACCPICQSLVGECDHLVASIDLTFSEFVAGAIFGHERVILDLAEQLATTDPGVLKAAGAGAALERVATVVAADVEEGMSKGDAVSVHFPQVMAALSHMLQENDDVSVTEVEAASGEDSSIENLWAEDAEWIVEQLIDRLQELTDEIEAG